MSVINPNSLEGWAKGFLESCRYLGPSQLPKLFAALSQAKSQFGLNDFAVCQSSLEQVFNSFAAEQEQEKKD